MISLGAKPHQLLNATFLQRVFTRIGGLDREGDEVNSKPSQKVTDVKYRFQCSWFQRWPWLHYLEATDSILCYYCAKANALKITCGQRGLRGDLAFVSTGYHNWKAATDSRKGFAKHEHFTYHLTAIQALSNKSDDIRELLSDAHRAEKDTNRQMLLHVYPL